MNTDHGHALDLSVHAGEQTAQAGVPFYSPVLLAPQHTGRSRRAHLRVAGAHERPNEEPATGETEFVFDTARSSGLRRWATQITRRAFDVVFAAAALAVTVPLFLALVLLIRATSVGPAIYRHNRIGQNATDFECLKFRTMVVDADAALEAVFEASPELRREFEATQKLKADPRVTRVGRFLRKTSLDELPQFWNILRGEMSVVGPRPIVEDEIPKYGASLPIVLSVKPGLTGLWQVSGRNDVTYGERVALDRHYVLNRNFWSDLKIVAKTATVMLKSDNGAY